MVKRSNKKQIVHKLTKSGKYTLYVVVPKTLVSELRWRERQKVVIRRYGEGILIKDWKR